MEELASASKDILAQCALKCSAIGEDELRERENLRYALAVARIPRKAGSTYARTYACVCTLMSTETCRKLVHTRHLVFARCTDHVLSSRQELEDLRVQHESERLDMQQQHQSEMAKYRIKMSTLEDTVWQKIERIARLVGGTRCIGLRSDYCRCNRQ